MHILCTGSADPWMQTGVDTMSDANPFLFDRPLSELDPEITRLVEAEGSRQDGKIILIASESLCPAPVAEALASPFSAIYAEGYPSTRMMEWERDRVHDHARHLAFNRRYADRRYYKGCEYVNFIEVLAQKRAAELFAANGLRPEDLHVNVQPLSGSVANSAIYTAFLEPGDLLMGMALPHGGHLTHGSELNRSGKHFRILPYLLDPKTSKLDYQAIIDAAREHQPRMLIAGGSAYPWALDWEALRRAASQVRKGCFLLADISHPAGLVATGEFPSPVGYADVISLTTHKTLCGPRGAIVITTDRDRAKAVDQGVFPGEQGGPHIHQIAAKAVAFGIALTEEFGNLMRMVKSNASVLASELMELGVKVQGGGTESHLFLVDLKATRKDSGVPLYGDIAANILDLCNITVNKNTIPGDEAAAHPTGIRLGTTLISQQGHGEATMRQLARLIHRVIEASRTFTVTTGGGVRGRARVPLEILEEVREAVASITGARPPDSPAQVLEGAEAGTLEVRGERSGVFLQDILTTDVLALKPGESQRSLMLDSASGVMAELDVTRETPLEGFDRYRLQTAAAGLPRMENWLRGLTDGYLDFDDDITRKVDGPVAIERVDGEQAAAGSPLPAPAAPGERQRALDRLKTEPALFNLNKPWFIGRAALNPERASESAAVQPYTPEPSDELKKTPVNALHRKLTVARNMVPFAGWDMPVLYTSIKEEHQAVRQGAGLFDVAHMGTMDVRGEGAARFLDLLTTNFVWRLVPGQSQYSYVLRPDGSVMDNLLIDMRAPDDYMVVANAANAPEVLDHFRRTAAGDAPLCLDRPLIRPDAYPEIRDLRDPTEAGDDMLVDLSIQGPASQETLLRFAASSPEATSLIGGLRKSELARVSASGFDLVVSFTGYTGEEWGYEIFVHPDRAADLFSGLLEVGADLGVKPAGLGARDSLRCEAGFPLHGHELAGPQKILPAEAGYAPFVKEHKPFFVGREPHLATARKSRRQIARVQLERTGIRMVQPGDPVANARGQVVGSVTSSVLPGDHQIALALVDVPTSRPGGRVIIYGKPRRRSASPYKPVEELTPGDAVPVGEAARVIDRFPATRDEIETAGTS